MSGTGSAFRWLDLLEKEFDKSYVDLDIGISELETDEPDLVASYRRHLGALSSCWAQLSHKAQTVFQNSIKTEAELVNLRTELIESQAQKEILESELHAVLLQLHSMQSNLTGTDQQDLRNRIQEALEKSPSRQIETSNTSLQLAQVRAQASQWQKENESLRNTILALHSEVYGARLAAKYLDKELAGRIQQLQLLGREMKGALRDKLWRQLEAEILLQRHKTVVRACRSIGSSNSRTNSASIIKTGNRSPPEPPLRGLGEPREVLLQRQPKEGLGFSITGGREHGVPILISELEVGGPAARSQLLYVGDAIIRVNNTDLQQASHQEAVVALQSVTGNCSLVVQFVAADSDDENSLSEDGYNFHYKFFEGVGLERPDVATLTPTAPRTPEPDNGVTGPLVLDNYLDNDNNNPASSTVIPYTLGSNPVNSQIQRNMLDYESPMRESTDSSDNLLSLISSDEQSPKCYSNYNNMTMVNENLETTPCWIGTSDDNSKENINSLANKLNDSPKIDDVYRNSYIVKHDHFLAKQENLDKQYYYYLDQENYSTSSYRNSSLNSSLASTPIHKKKAVKNDRTVVDSQISTKKNVEEQLSVMECPEPNPGIQTIDQIFSKHLNSPEIIEDEKVEESEIDFNVQNNEEIQNLFKVVENVTETLDMVNSVEKFTSNLEHILEPRVLETKYKSSNQPVKVSEDNVVKEITKTSEELIQADRERLQKCFSSKPKGLRIGYARRVPPKDDVTHIPLKVDKPVQKLERKTSNVSPKSLDEELDMVNLRKSVENIVKSVERQMSAPTELTRRSSHIEGKGDPALGTPV